MKKTESFRNEQVHGYKFGYAPIGKPNLFVHVYYVDGLLIDTGQHRMSSHILAITQKLNIEQIFITHHHEDHSGNISQLKAQHNCPIYASEMTCQMMKSPPELSLVQKIMWGDRHPYHDLIPIEKELKTKHHCFDIIPIPGHAPDMVALFEKERKWLFSADLFINSYIGYFLKDESILDQIESTRRILKLDFDILFCAHNPQLKNGKDKLIQKLNFLESFFEEVSVLHQKGYSSREIFKILNLKENQFVKMLSAGKLSKLNMVKSAIRDSNRNRI